jgi:hypothetical protein
LHNKPNNKRTRWEVWCVGERGNGKGSAPIENPKIVLGEALSGSVSVFIGDNDVDEGGNGGQRRRLSLGVNAPAGEKS